MAWQIGCGQITWDRSVAEEQVLAEIAQAGYEGAPAGPQDGRSPEDTIAVYARHGLKPAPGYFSAAFWRAEERAAILEQAEAFAHYVAALGCTEMYVAPSGFDYVTQSGAIRSQLAGHVRPEDGLSADEFARFADTLNACAARTLRAGVRSCFHNHVGAVIETEDEVTRLLDRTDPQAVFLGLDTGHLAWAGVGVVPFCRRYAERIATLHLKDINQVVRARGAAAHWDYRTFSDNGIFTELGDGDVNIPGVLDLLREQRFAGWLIVETDETQRPSALESATISRKYLRSLGV